MAFKWDVNLGHMLTAVPLVIIGTVYVVTDHNAVVELTSSYVEIKSDVRKGFDSIRTEIRLLPIVQANMDQFRAGLDDNKLAIKDLRANYTVDHEAAIRSSNKVDVLTDRVSGLEIRVNGMAPILDNLDRGAKVQLGRKN